MKEIKAIIDTGFLYQVMEALHALPHFPGATISDAQGQGRGRGEGGKHVSYGDPLSFRKKIKLEICCADAAVDQYVSAIHKAAHHGRAGHGIIMVRDLTRVLRISTGQEQDEAV
jgi:nitrogen regulatory protein P-II 1